MWFQSTYRSVQELLYVAITQCQTQSFAVQSFISYALFQFHLERMNFELFHCIAMFLLSLDGASINKTETAGNEYVVFAQITIVNSDKLHNQGIWIFVVQFQSKYAHSIQP